jgi:hypothetical protein
MKKKIDLTKIETYVAYFATINYGDGPRCAWCNKKNPSSLHLEIHDKITKIKRFFRLTK